MSEQLVSLENIRALAQGIIEEADHMTDEVGAAGAHEERAKATVARRILDVIDGPITTEIADRKQRAGRLCRCAFCGYTAVCGPADDFYSNGEVGGQLACHGCMLLRRVPSPVAS